MYVSIVAKYFLIKSVNIQNEYSNTYVPEGLTGQGCITPQTKDYVFKLKLEDMGGEDMAHNPNVDPSLDIYINNQLYKENYKLKMVDDDTSFLVVLKLNLF